MTLIRKVAEAPSYANGINISPDRQTVYVAATVGKKIYVYDRDRNAGDLTLRRTIDTGTGVDNIEIDQNGNLGIGCHPKLLFRPFHMTACKILGFSVWMREKTAASGKAKAFTFFTIYSFENSVRML